MIRPALLLAVAALLIAGCGGKEKDVSPAPVTTPTTAKSPRTVPLAQYDRISISVNDKELNVYVADEVAERSEGLMFVKDGELGENEGMIFTFPNAQMLSFWMENTLIPLDIAYLDDGGKIINIRQMQPLDTSPQPSEAPARYAVETNLGWFEKNGIKPGAVFDLSSLSQ